MKIYFVLYYSYCYGHKYDCEVQAVCEGGKEPSVLMTKRDVCDE